MEALVNGVPVEISESAGLAQGRYSDDSVTSSPIIVHYLSMTVNYIKICTDENNKVEYELH